MPEPQSGADVLARIQPRLREESTHILLRPDLLDAWEEAVAELGAAKDQDGRGERLATGTSRRTKDLAKKVQALEEQIEALQLKVTFRAMPADEWSVLCEQHPPRRGNDLDQYAGYDREAVMKVAVRECMIDPVFDDKSWAEFCKVLNPSEWRELTETVNSVNRSVKSAPKSALAASVLARPAAGSKSPASGE